MKQMNSATTRSGTRNLPLLILAAAVVCAPFFMFIRTSVWIGPVCLLLVMIALGSAYHVFPVPGRHPAYQPQKLHPSPLFFVNMLALAGIYALTLLVFYEQLDIWETWTWLMHTQEPPTKALNDGLEAVPPLIEVLNNPSIGRWRGPHITHGMLHSQPMLVFLRQFVVDNTRRLTVNEIMRAINALSCLCLIPLLFVGFRRLGILRHIEIPIFAALLSPGIFTVGVKGHWIGISYGLACLGGFLGMSFLHTGAWRYLAAFALIWGLLQGFYTGAVFFLMICGFCVLLYLQLCRHPPRYSWRGAVLIGCAAILLGITVGQKSLSGVARHFKGNGETLFEIKDNTYELQRFAGYWERSAKDYKLAQVFQDLPLFYKAGLGMVDQNIRSFFRNLFGTGNFSSLWFFPNSERIKTFGFVLPWFCVLGMFFLTLQHHLNAVKWQLLLFTAMVAILFALLLFTWVMSAHRIFGINLFLAGLSGVVYDQGFTHQEVISALKMRHVLLFALCIQALLFLATESVRFL